MGRLAGAAIAALAFAAAACQEEEQAQGKIFYGTFSMSAARDYDGCSVGGQAAFTQVVTLSADPADGGAPRFYLRVVGQGDREGTIRGAAFAIDSPPVAQAVEKCPCVGTQIAERIEGVLSYPGVDAGPDAGLPARLPDGGWPEDQPAPAIPDAGLLPETFSGKLTDTLYADAGVPCACAALDAGPCQVVFTLQGTRQ